MSYTLTTFWVCRNNTGASFYESMQSMVKDHFSQSRGSRQSSWFPKRLSASHPPNQHLPMNPSPHAKSWHSRVSCSCLLICGVGVARVPSMVRPGRKGKGEDEGTLSGLSKHGSGRSCPPLHSLCLAKLSVCIPNASHQGLSIPSMAASSSWDWLPGSSYPSLEVQQSNALFGSPN